MDYVRKQTKTNKQTHFYPDTTTGLEAMALNSQTVVPKFHFLLRSFEEMWAPAWGGHGPRFQGLCDYVKVIDFGRERQNMEATSTSPAWLRPGTLSSDQDVSCNE